MAKRIYKISFKKAIGALAVAFISGGVSFLFGAASVVNTDHFTTVANSEKVALLEQTTVKKETYNLQYEYICGQFDDLGKKIDSLTTAVNNLYAGR